MPVIFDLGNVVLNWNPEAIVKTLPFEESIQTTILRELFEHPDWQALDKGTKTEKQVVSRLAQSTDVNREQALTALQRARESLVEIPETVNLMEEFAGRSIELYCLSNMSIDNFEHIRRKPFFRLFTGVVISAVEKVMKPQAEIFQRLLDRYQLRASELLFIDDLTANIEAAARFGIDGVVFHRDPASYQRIRTKVSALQAV